MTSFSIAFNYISDAHTEDLIQVFSPFGCKQFFVAAKTPQTMRSDLKLVGGYGIEYRQSLEEILNQCKSDLILFLLRPVIIQTNKDFHAWLQFAAESEEAFHYSSYFIKEQGSEQISQQPCIDYSFGSVRDDFDFGPLVALQSKPALEILKEESKIIIDDISAFYGLRLASSILLGPRRFKSYSYTSVELPKDEHDAHFAYASAKGSSSQKALEYCFTRFARRCGFYLEGDGGKIEYARSGHKFENKASIIIPVKNRAGKVEQAVNSALSQKADFKFNVIVVDNHSTDGTTEIIKNLAAQNSNLIHLVPEALDLGIGGCWQLAVGDPRCGEFVAQLDSDDLYINERVLSRIIQEFNESQAAAVVGSYLLVDKDLNPLPPGAIEHREWNDSNGRNNILRINGLGAPRAFYTPVIREIGFPNVSYGEDYAAMLAISRKFKISRIYEHLYLCRRWDGNSDAKPSIEKMNTFNSFKDSLRNIEIEQRLFDLEKPDTRP